MRIRVQPLHKAREALPADDPDRPTMKRRTNDAGSDSGSGSTTAQTSGSTPADDPDRPTMKKRSPDTSDTTR